MMVNKIMSAIIRGDPCSPDYHIASIPTATSAWEEHRGGWTTAPHLQGRAVLRERGAEEGVDGVKDHIDDVLLQDGVRKMLLTLIAHLHKAERIKNENELTKVPFLTSTVLCSGLCQDIVAVSQFTVCILRSVHLMDYPNSPAVEVHFQCTLLLADLKGKLRIQKCKLPYRRMLCVLLLSPFFFRIV